MGEFKLFPDPSAFEVPVGPVAVGGLPGEVLRQNACWFTRIRWMVVMALAGFGAGGRLLSPDTLARVGLNVPGSWPLLLAALLAAVNLGACRWLKRLPLTASWRSLAANIWFQIIADLLVLTALVCRVGPTSTVIAFAYLFHIALACIFFCRRDSLIVTLLSVALYLTAVALELAGHPFPPLFTYAPAHAPGFLPALGVAIPTLFIWLIAWYLVSSLSDTVRQRDRDLEAANGRILQADEDINQQMLRVTHDLKAPFAGIESNIHILKMAHGNELSADARRIIGKIVARSMSLRARIGDILMLGNLRSAQEEGRVVEPVDLHETLGTALQELQGLAADRKVTVRLAPGDAVVRSDPRQLQILFANLISNAIVYSHEGGVVDLAIEPKRSGARVLVADHGIGISEEGLKNIFDDFYRTQEAAAFNPNSTGLGLAIVRQIARTLRLTVTVKSEQGKGTEFMVSIPSPEK